MTRRAADSQVATPVPPALLDVHQQRLLVQYKHEAAGNRRLQEQKRLVWFAGAAGAPTKNQLLQSRAVTLVCRSVSVSRHSCLAFRIAESSRARERCPVSHVEMNLEEGSG
jgi:hypothetical protein